MITPRSRRTGTRSSLHRCSPPDPRAAAIPALHAKHFPPHDVSPGPDLYGRSALKRAQDQKKQEIAMNRIARAVVFMFVVLGLVASVAPANAPGHNDLTATFDGTQPPVPPKATFFDGTQPPVP